MRWLHIQKKQLQIPSLLLNFIGFEFVWIALVTQGNSVAPAGVCFALIHLAFLRFPSNEIKFIIIVSLLGIMLDALLTTLGVFKFSNQASLLGVPLWLASLWVGFACTINHSLFFLKRSKLLQALFAAIFAPLSYYVGFELNAVTFGYSIVQSMLVLAVAWVAFLPFCFYLSKIFSEKGYD